MHKTPTWGFILRRIHETTTCVFVVGKYSSSSCFCKQFKVKRRRRIPGNLEVAPVHHHHHDPSSINSMKLCHLSSLFFVSSYLSLLLSLFNLVYCSLFLPGDGCYVYNVRLEKRRRSGAWREIYLLRILWSWVRNCESMYTWWGGSLRGVYNQVF